MSWEEVRDELVIQGINEEGAQTVVDNLRKQERNAWKSASKKEIGYGLLWALGGIADSYYRRNTHLLGCGRLGNLADIEGNNDLW